MASIDDVMRVAEALEKNPVVMVRDRCVAVRNRNASCRACVRVCPAKAVEVSANEAAIDASACIACGACIAVCPTEAIVMTSPTNSELIEAATAALEDNGGKAVVACARIAAKRTADPARFAEVPCLPHVDEGLAVRLVAKGATSVLLVDGNCRTCKNRACSAHVDDSVRHANVLLEQHGSTARVERSTGFPADMQLDSDSDVFGSTRRGFFSQAADMARETAKTAAVATLESELGYTLDEESIGVRLRVTDQGTLPQLSMARHVAAIDALDRIGQPDPLEGVILQTRLFGSVDIDAGRCNACGMCAVFCPTGALSRDVASKPSSPLKYLEFSASDCVQCGLCTDVCWKGALSLSTDVAASELYDFEPRTFDLRNAENARRNGRRRF